HAWSERRRPSCLSHHESFKATVVSNFFRSSGFANLASYNVHLDLSELNTTQRERHDH
ncbi:hypothetical protein K443DRAFT_664511, partial [Laccaria amethystina LaAM-08-1]